MDGKSNKLNISGPVSFIQLKDNVNNIFVSLFGDDHLKDKVFNCTAIGKNDDISIIEFINKISNEKNTNIYLEGSVIPSNLEDNDYLSETVFNMQKQKKTNVYFLDDRESSLGDTIYDRAVVSQTMKNALGKEHNEITKGELMSTYAQVIKILKKSSKTIEPKIKNNIVKEKLWDPLIKYTGITIANLDKQFSHMYKGGDMPDKDNYDLLVNHMMIIFTGFLDFITIDKIVENQHINHIIYYGYQHVNKIFDILRDIFGFIKLERIILLSEPDSKGQINSNDRCLELEHTYLNNITTIRQFGGRKRRKQKKDKSCKLNFKMNNKIKSSYFYKYYL